ncbi:MAG: trehalose-phosphatase [Gammaproteobacteria bacterium]|nr:trehalose-phosphatase [Gammaproteobacteria bacterium]
MNLEIGPRELANTLKDRLGDRRLVVFLDYDGTLSQIVQHPAYAVLDEPTRRVLAGVAAVHPVYVISGRDLDDVRERVAVEGIYCVGSHGFQMPEAAPGIDPLALEEAAYELRSAADELEQWLDYIDGVVIERKRYSFALHYRMVDRDDLKQIHAAAADVLERYGSVTSKRGKQVIEFIPDIPWDKGLCLQALMARLDDSDDARPLFPMYIGDDVTDEDAFRVLDPATGMSVVVAEDERDSAAEFRLSGVPAVRAFLEELIRP